MPGVKTGYGEHVRMTKLREKDVMTADVMEGRGHSIRSLAGDFGVDESTLRYRLMRLRSGADDGRRRQPEACGEFGEEISAWMEEQATRVEDGGRSCATVLGPRRLGG